MFCKLNYLIKKKNTIDVHKNIKNTMNFFEMY